MMSKLVAWLLRLYPEEFRRSHEEELFEFMEQERKRQSTGIRFWLSTSFDLVRGAVRLHRQRKNRFYRPERTREWLSDLRHGLRSMRSTPLVTIVILVTLALGIGLNTAIFSVVRGVLLKPLPYEEPERLVYLGARWVTDGVRHANHTGKDFQTLRDSARSFEDVAAVLDIRQNLTGVEPPAQVQVGWASRNLFDVIGVAPILGPGFTGDAPPGTALLSHHLWQGAFGGDPDIVGRVVRLDDYPYTISGVLPHGFELYTRRFPARIDIWKVPDDWWQNGDLWNAEGVEFALLDLIGRLRDDVTLEQAQAEMDRFAETFRRERIDHERAGLEYAVAPLHETVVGDVRPHLLLLFGAVGLVLLVACANVMNLMMARAQARTREISLRLALGSPRSWIVRLLLTESLLLALLGGIGGVLVGAASLELLRTLRPENLPRLDGVSMDPGVLAFALAVSLASTLVFGLVPALGAARRNLTENAATARVTDSRKQQRSSRLLVVGELAISLVLLVAAGLLTTSLSRLADVRPGFDYEALLTFSISLPGTQYERPEGTDRFFRELEDRIEALQGVRSAGIVWPLPLSHRAWSNQYVAGGVLEGERRYAEYRLATPDLFETMRIPLLDGTSFSRGNKRHVVLVSRNLAEHAWPGRSPIGRTIRASPWGGGLEEFEVLGVVDDVRYADIRETPRETIYFDSRGWSWTDWEVDYVVRTAATPESLIEPIREELAFMDGSIPMARVRPMREYVDEHLASNKFALSLIGLFAVVAGILAVVGLYGVMSYAVTQRSHEIGVRMALGAGRSSILTWVVKQGAILMAVGIAIGLVAALSMTHLLSSLLYGVEASDPETFILVAGTLAIVGISACYAPARRATKLDPMEVLRAD